MLEYEKVTLEVRLPPDIAADAAKVQIEEPEFLSRVVLYGLTRRSIYRGIRDRSREAWA